MKRVIIPCVNFDSLAEYIIFCKPSEIQRHVYEAISDVMTLEAFSQIDLLKKLCNHPALVYKSVHEGEIKERTGQKVDFWHKAAYETIFRLRSSMSKTSNFA